MSNKKKHFLLSLIPSQSYISISKQVISLPSDIIYSTGSLLSTLCNRYLRSVQNYSKIILPNIDTVNFMIIMNITHFLRFVEAKIFFYSYITKSVWTILYPRKTWNIQELNWVYEKKSQPRIDKSNLSIASTKAHK